MASKTATRSALTGIGILLAGVLFVAVNMLSGSLFQGMRLDLTSDRLFTLSQGTRAILAKIDEPIVLRFYYSERLGREIPSYGVYAQRVREMLYEYRDAARGKLRLDVIDPPAFSDEEDRAVGFGLQAVPLNQQGENVYFGLAGSNGADREEVIPFFQPERERFLEYDLTKAVYNLSVVRSRRWACSRRCRWKASSAAAASRRRPGPSIRSSASSSTCAPWRAMPPRFPPRSAC